MTKMGLLKKCIFAFGLFCGLFLSIEAATTSHTAEIGFALATIPFDIAAQTCQTNNNPKKAALLAALADITSLAGRSLSVHNNIEAQKMRGDWSMKKDLFINGVFALRDLTKLYTHFKKAFGNPADLVDLPDQPTDPAVSDEELDVDDEKLPLEEITRFENILRTYLLPSMKGLAAFALAYTQDYATTYSNEQTRYVATATYSLIRLVEEYKSLKQDSPQQKNLITLIIANILWLAYEIKQYTLNRPATMPTLNGNCPVCGGENIQLNRLRCGHTCCRDCLQQQVNVAFMNDRSTFDHIKCPCIQHCPHMINRNEIEELTGNDPRNMKAFDSAASERCANPKTNSDLLDRLRRDGADANICPGCNNIIVRNGGCNHMTCTRCRNEFCFVCRAPFTDQHYNCQRGAGGVPQRAPVVLPPYIPPAPAPAAPFNPFDVTAAPAADPWLDDYLAANRRSQFVYRTHPPRPWWM